MTLAPIDRLSSLDESACDELRTRLRAIGFGPELIAQTDAFHPGAFRQPRLPIVRWWLERRPEPGAALARLFVYEGTLSESEARSALGAESFHRLLDAGIVGKNPSGDVSSPFLLTPAQSGVWILSDPLGAGRDAVMGPGGGTEQLASLVPNGFSGNFLDLGCGAGTLALVGARRGARRAVGVDLNPRAVEVSRFNARLNGLDVEFRAGNSAEPVTGERFDLVLCQPPFVGRPKMQDERTFLFGGAAGDELPLRMLGDVPPILTGGGRAIFLIQSATRPGEPLIDRVRRALGDASLHVLVVAGTGPTPGVQASMFAAFDDPSFGVGYERAVRAYLDHFEELGVRTFDGAIVAVTNPATEFGPGRYALALSLGQPPGDATAFWRFLGGLDLIEAPDDFFERARLQLSPHVRITQPPEPQGGENPPTAVIRIAAPGIGSDWPLSAPELEVLAAVHGAPSLGAALDAVIRAAPPLAAMRGDLRTFARTALLHGALVHDG